MLQNIRVIHILVQKLLDFQGRVFSIRILSYNTTCWKNVLNLEGKNEKGGACCGSPNTRHITGAIKSKLEACEGQASRKRDEK